MKYKVILELTEHEVVNYIYSMKKISPLYKSDPDENDINWIHKNKDLIIGSPCEYAWDLYQVTFPDDVILSRNKLYSAIKSELNVKSKPLRLTQDVVKNCFVSKVKMAFQ